MQRESTLHNALLILTLLMTACSTGLYIRSDEVVQLDVSFGDAKWNGLTIPLGEECNRCGGHGSTPSLIVKNIPPKANAIIMEYCDRSYQPMNFGGHGIIGFRIEPGTEKVFIPSVPGHSYNLPDKFFIVLEHLKPNYDIPGAYLPPCSCGGGNYYYVNVKAVFDSGEKDTPFLLLGEYELGLGVAR